MKVERVLKTIYIIKQGDFYKIGYASNMKSRLANHNTSSPHNIEVVIQREMGSAMELEKELHKKYEEHKHKGEWFIFSNDIIEELKIYIENYLDNDIDTRKKFFKDLRDNN